MSEWQNGHSDQQLIDQYFKLAKKLDDLTCEFKEKTEPFNKAMTAIKGMLHERLNHRGAKHTSVEGGTAFKTLSTQVKCESKQEYLRFCFSNPDEGANLLTSNVSKDALAAFIEKNGDTPPGLTVNYVETVQIRRT
jgi:hypothetical protein